MVSAMLCSAWCSFIDSAFHRCTTSLNRDAAVPPHTDCGTPAMRPMNACSAARISSLRVSMAAATERMRSKSVLSALPPAGALTGSPSRRRRGPPAVTTSKTDARRIWFPPHSVHYPRGSDRHITLPADGVATTTAALAADADPDRLVHPHCPPDVVTGPDFSVGHRRASRTTV